MSLFTIRRRSPGEEVKFCEWSHLEQTPYCNFYDGDTVPLTDAALVAIRSTYELKGTNFCWLSGEANAWATTVHLEVYGWQNDPLGSVGRI